MKTTKAPRWTTESGRPLHGLLAEFDNPQALVDAAHRVHSEGYHHVDGYTPYPIEALSEALGHHHSKLPALVLGGGITGLLAGYGLQYWTQVLVYPMNIGGRPFHSWPAFIPPTYEMTILFAALTAVFGMIALNGLPQPYHPVFNVARFARASRDRYFLGIDARDPKFDPRATRDLLASLGSTAVSEVED